MRLEKFLFESDFDEDDNGIYWTNKNDIGKIHANCSEIIKIYKKSHKFFYRGLKINNDKMIRKKPRLRRQPKDMPMRIQKVLDEYYYEKFGWKPRSQGVFAVSTFNTAQEYGRPHVIFPFDGFEYVWSPKIADAYSTFGSTGDYDADSYMYILKHGPLTGKGHWKKGSKIVKNIEKLENFVDYDQEFDEYDPDSVDNMIYSVELKLGDEIHCEEWKWIPDITYNEFLKNIISKQLSSYKNTGIVQCLSKGYEIMFKCSYYYAIPADDSLSPESFGL